MSFLEVEPYNTQRSRQSPAVAAAELAPEAEAHEDEQSIEQYMLGLLERVRNPAGTAQDPSAESKRPSENQPQAVAVACGQSPKETPSTPGVPATATYEKSADTTPRKRATESADSVSLMRGLANLNARAALQTHSIKQLTTGAVRTLALAMIVIGTSLLALQTEFPSRTLACVIAMAGVVVSAACCCHYVRITEAMAANPACETLREGKTGDQEIASCAAEG